MSEKRILKKWWCNRCQKSQKECSCGLYPRVSDSLDPVVSLCECGSGDISLCNISHRYHCNECNNWPPPHWNKPEHALKQWNNWVKNAN